jgi:hypothetical protein
MFFEKSAASFATRALMNVATGLEFGKGRTMVSCSDFVKPPLQRAIDQEFPARPPADDGYGTTCPRRAVVQLCVSALYHAGKATIGDGADGIGMEPPREPPPTRARADGWLLIAPPTVRHSSALRRCLLS